MSFKQYKDDFLNDLATLISINSVNGNCGTAAPGTPLGKGINDALNAFLEIGERFGFKTKNLDGYCGYIEMGTGEEMVGIVGHVDTVATGDGWSYPPLECTVTQDGVYGRGVTDDKGPALLALYAMHHISRQGNCSKRIRLILGGDEESGSWKCMERYQKTEEAPAVAFSPDAEYPVVFGEKGLLKVKISGRETAMPADFSFEGGSVINIVPDKAHAFIDGKALDATGKAAHGSLPHKGDNAVLKLAGEISEKYPESTFAKLYSLSSAKALGIDISDKESGNLSINPSILSADSKECALSYDIRYPITADGEAVIASIRRAAEEKGLTVEILFHDAPLYVPLESHLVKTLSGIYQSVTGDNSSPIAIGGGTYAKAFRNCVAFGVMLPDDPDTMHAPDEFWSFKSMDINFEIISKAIEAL